jgi:hypothetical protein
VLARSGPFPVQDRHHYPQREWMMRAAWGPVLERAIGLIARGTGVLAAVGAAP